MNYKAVAFDMDGTLLNANKQILPATITVLKQLQHKGIEIVLVTGRHHAMIYPYYRQLGLDSLTICCNGAYLYDFDKQKALDGNPISKENALLLLDKVEEYGVHTLVYTDAHFWYKDWDDNLETLSCWIQTLPVELQPKLDKTTDFRAAIQNANEVYKFSTSSNDIPSLRIFSDEVEKMNLFECEWSWVNRADVAAKGSNKGRGLELWAKRSSIDLSEIVAFGDNFNDLTMLKKAGLGIVMGNAEEEIKAQGDKVIADHNSEAIAECLRELFQL